MAKEKIPISIGPGTLYRLNACEPRRDQWRRQMGGADYPVTPAFVAKVVDRGFPIDWFLARVCGPKTLIAIGDDIQAAIGEDVLAVQQEEEYREAVERALTATQLPMVIAPYAYASSSEAIDRYRRRVAAFNYTVAVRDSLHEAPRYRGEARLLRLCYALEIVRRLDKRAMRGCEALAATVVNRSRVINRALSIANTRTRRV